ncbi:unnamed protein product [Caenorhabditis angaria]|uniref:PAN-3 domain-containing protein n=1 Tax=Caenorhabditis angaria TaxID=860376 RepID=A0A9P1IJG0_9PELO|nr:unnamed protein product [Caenorhabditis angaria]
MGLVHILLIASFIISLANCDCIRYIESDSSIVELATTQRSQGTLNYTECLSVCQLNASCVIASSLASGECLTVDFGNAKLVHQSGQYLGSKLSIKVNIPDDSCDLTDEEVLQGLRMNGLTGSTNFAKYRYWQIMQKDPNHIVFNHVLKLDHGDCWDSWYEDVNQQFCYTFLYGDYDLTTARETCDLFSAHLYGAASPDDDAWYAALGMRRNSIVNGSILLGARRKYTCLGQSTGDCAGDSGFEFTDPYVYSLNPRTFLFGTGYPVANKDCYALQVPLATNGTNYKFINVNCDGSSENLVGIACAAPLIRDLPPNY